MKQLFFFLGALLINCQTPVFSQETRMVFYNVENLFDTRDDSLTRDEEFTPQGLRHWTEDRLFRKIVRIYQVMAAIGQGEMPALVGLCEVENRVVLNRLVYDTPLDRAGYRLIHRDSPDSRGIDVALLYRHKLFEADTAEWLPVNLPGGNTTREILKVTGRLWGEDTLVVYINHWPSRYGGASGSAPNRLRASQALAASVREVLADNPGANIVIMGDFNDGPAESSLLELEKIAGLPDNGQDQALINVSGKTGPGRHGTIKHQGTWEIFDQIIVSASLVNGSRGLELTGNGMEIFDAGFLMEPDLNYSGDKVFRTYIGPAYHGGFSDHLPVSIRIARTIKPALP